MLTYKRSIVAAILGVELETLRPAIVAEDGEWVTLDPDHPVYPGNGTPNRKPHTPRPTLEQIGPQLWERMHTATSPDAELIKTVTKALPCGECKAHWRQYLKDNPPDFGDGWKAWTIAAHNTVNVRLGRETWTMEQAKGRWS